MGDGNRYTNRLDEINNREQKLKNKKRFKKAYESWEHEKPRIYGEILERVREHLPDIEHHYFKGNLAVYTRALARRGMIQAKEDNSIPLAFNSAILYERLGKGNIGVTKLMEVLEKATKSGRVLDDITYQEISNFIKRNSGSKRRQSGLEGKTMVFFLSILGGLVLSARSLMVTGNIVGSLLETTGGLLGIFLFMFGLAGILFNKRL